MRGTNREGPNREHRQTYLLSGLLTDVKYQSPVTFVQCRGQMKCDGIRAETRFRLSAKRTSPFKSAGASVQSTTGS